MAAMAEGKAKEAADVWVKVRVGSNQMVYCDLTHRFHFQDHRRVGEAAQEEGAGSADGGAGEGGGQAEDVRLQPRLAGLRSGKVKGRQMSVKLNTIFQHAIGQFGQFLHSCDYVATSELAGCIQDRLHRVRIPIRVGC